MEQAFVLSESFDWINFYALAQQGKLRFKVDHSLNHYFSIGNRNQV